MPGYKPGSLPIKLQRQFGGSGEIRTHGPLSGPAVFKTAAINRTLPRFQFNLVVARFTILLLPDVCCLWLHITSITGFPLWTRLGVYITLRAMLLLN